MWSKRQLETGYPENEKPALQLSQVSKQRRPFVRRQEPTIDNQAIRRKNAWQIRRRIQPGHGREKSDVVVEHRLERLRRVVVKVRGSFANAA